MASGSARPIPWKKFIPRARECISETFLPAEYLKSLAEPSAMRDNECYTMLRFWYQRQTDSQSPTFQFSFYLSQDDLLPAKDRELVQAMSEPPVSSRDVTKSMNKPKIKRGKKLRLEMKDKGKSIQKGKRRATSCDEDTTDSSEVSSESDSFDSDSEDTVTKDDDLEEEAFTWDLPIKQGSASPLLIPAVNAIASSSKITDISAERLATSTSSKIELSVTPSTKPSIIPKYTSSSHPSPANTDSEEEKKEQADLVPELQEIAERLGKREVADLSALLLQMLQKLKVTSASPSPLKNDEPRKRQRLPSPDPTPSSPTKKMKTLTLSSEERSSEPQIPEEQAMASKLNNDAVVKKLFTKRDPITDILHPAELPSEQQSADTTMATQTKPAATGTRKTTKSMLPKRKQPKLLVSVDIAHGTRSKTKQVEQSQRRGTRANPT